MQSQTDSWHYLQEMAGMSRTPFDSDMLSKIKSGRLHFFVGLVVIWAWVWRDRRSCLISWALHLCHRLLPFCLQSSSHESRVVHAIFWVSVLLAYLHTLNHTLTMVYHGVTFFAYSSFWNPLIFFSLSLLPWRMTLFLFYTILTFSFQFSLICCIVCYPANSLVACSIGSTRATQTYPILNLFAI